MSRRFIRADNIQRLGGEGKREYPAVAPGPLDVAGRSPLTSARGR